MRFCPHCNGTCTNKPDVGSVDNYELKVKIEDCYKYQNWYVNLVGQGYILHEHDDQYFGAFSHYWSKEQGWPDREPILICSHCDMQVPDNVKSHLRGAYELLRPK